MKPRVVNLEQTCTACPSQWEGELENGQHVCIRYHHGCLRVGVGSMHWTAVANAMGHDGTPVMEVYHGGVYDGLLSTNEMQELTARYLEFKEGIG